LEKVKSDDSDVVQMVELLKQSSDFDLAIANLEKVADILGEYENRKFFPI
jgi:hypothetical protein